MCREVFCVNNILVDNEFEKSEGIIICSIDVYPINDVIIFIEAKQCSKLYVECSPWDSDNSSHTMESLRSFIQWHLEKALSFQFEFGQSTVPCGDDDEESSQHNLNSMLGMITSHVFQLLFSLFVIISYLCAVELEESVSDGAPDPALGEAAEPTDVEGLKISSDASLPTNVLSMSNIQTVVRQYYILCDIVFYFFFPHCRSALWWSAS